MPACTLTYQIIASRVSAAGDLVYTYGTEGSIDPGFSGGSFLAACLGRLDQHTAPADKLAICIIERPD